MWNDVSTRHLLALRAVHEEGTFGRAASRLGFTQSAVSQQVASLEQQVGHALFDRPAGPNPPRLTRAGELLLQFADKIIEDIQVAEHELDRFARGVTGRLAIGTFQSISARVLPTTLRQLRQHAPDVEVTLFEEDSDQELRTGGLMRGDLDLAFVVGDVPDGLECRYLGADPHVAVVGPDYADGPVELCELARQPMVGQPVNDSCGQLIERCLEQLGLSPNYVFRSYDNGAIQGMVGAGVGVALVPLLAVDTSDPATSVRATVPELAPRRLSIAWSQDRALSPVGVRFVDIATDVCADLLRRPID